MPESIFPDVPFETRDVRPGQICLRCGRWPARTGLFSIELRRVILPLCVGCSFHLHLYGLAALKPLRSLVWRMVWSKLCHPLATPSWWRLFQDLRQLAIWSRQLRATLRRK
jgi:hypothetical protein